MLTDSQSHLIYRSDSHGKLELYETLFENLNIGSEDQTLWDHNRAPSRPCRPFLPPGWSEKYFGPAPIDLDPDLHVRLQYAMGKGQGKKRDHDGGEIEVKSRTPASVPRENESSHELEKKSKSPTNVAKENEVQMVDSAAATPQPTANQTTPVPPPTQSSTNSTTASLTSPKAQQPRAASGNGGPLHRMLLPPVVPHQNGLQAPTPARPWSPTQLLYHGLHHTNIVISLVSTFLSQDALLRDFHNSNQPRGGLAWEHDAISRSVLAARGNMMSCRGAFIDNPENAKFNHLGCFLTWLKATDVLSAIVDRVDCAMHFQTPPSPAEIDWMKARWEEAMELRAGTDKDEAFQLCWAVVVGQR